MAMSSKMPPPRIKNNENAMVWYLPFFAVSRCSNCIRRLSTVRLAWTMDPVNSFFVGFSLIPLDFGAGK